MKAEETDLLKEFRADRKEMLKSIEQDLHNDLRSILSIPAGRNIIWWILEMSGVFVSSYTGNSDTYVNEGKRLIGLEVLHRITNAAPNAFLEMIQAGEKKE